MKKLLFLLGVSLILASCASVEKYNAQISGLHAVDDLKNEVDVTYNKIKKLHPKLYEYTPKKDLDFKFDSIKQSITKPITSFEFYKKMAVAIKAIRQGHTSIVPPKKRYNKQEREQLKLEKHEVSDLDFDYLESKLIVKSTRGNDSSFVGSEVIKMNSENVSDLLADYKSLFASDGYNTTLHNRFLGLRFLRFYFADKAITDSVAITFKNKDSLFVKTFKRIKKEEEKEKDLLAETPKKLTKLERKALRKKAKAKRKHNFKYGYNEKDKNYTRNLNFIGKDSTVAYMKIRRFTNGGFRDFYEESFKTLIEKNTQNLVIDLRDNPGGRLAEIDNLYSYLTDKDFVFIEESEVKSRIPYLKSFLSNTSSTGTKILVGLFSPIIAAHNLIKTKKRDGKLFYRFKQSKLQEPNPLHFTGKIYVLINGSSFSASSILSTQLKANKQAVFVGEETGGAYNGTVAGLFKIYELPVSKLILRMGLMQIETPFDQKPEGYGIKPDVEILPTLSDRQQNKDPELEWILNDIEQKKE